MTTPTLARLALLFGSLTIVGCTDGGKDDDTDTDTTTDGDDTDPTGTDDTDDTDAPAGPTGQVRAIHASPNAPAVSLWSGGSKLVDDLAYGETTDWLVLPVGTYDIDLCPAGAEACDTPVFSVDGVQVTDGLVLSAIAAGNFGSTDDADEFRVLPIVHGFDDAGDGVLARVIHASADAPAVGLDLGNDDPSSPEVASVARWADTGAAGAPLPSTSTTQIGIAAGGDTVTAFTIPALPAGSEWLVIATGFLGDKSYSATGFALLAVDGDNNVAWIKQNPRVYALHASPDAPTVDVFAGTSQLIDGLMFGDLEGVQVPPGTYTLDLFGTEEGSTRPAGDPAYSASGVEVEAGGEYLVLATGYFSSESAADQFRVVPVAADFEQGVDAALVQLFHASPDTPEVDVGPRSGNTLSSVVFADVAFGAASSNVAELPAGTYDLGASVDDANNVAVYFDDVPLAGTEQAWAIAAGELSDESQPLQVMLVDTKPTPWTKAAVLATFPPK